MDKTERLTQGSRIQHLDPFLGAKRNVSLFWGICRIFRRSLTIQSVAVVIDVSLFLLCTVYQYVLTMELSQGHLQNRDSNWDKPTSSLPRNWRCRCYCQTLGLVARLGLGSRRAYHHFPDLHLLLDWLACAYREYHYVSRLCACAAYTAQGRSARRTSGTRSTSSCSRSHGASRRRRRWRGSPSCACE